MSEKKVLINSTVVIPTVYIPMYMYTRNHKISLAKEYARVL